MLFPRYHKTHAPELGNRNHGGIQANFQTERGQEAVARVAGEANDTYHRIAIVCSEASWRRCHRQNIANHLWANFSKAVEHVRADGSLEPHPLHHIPIIVEEMPGTASTARIDPQPPTASVQSHEGETVGFTLTPDGKSASVRPSMQPFGLLLIIAMSGS